MEKARRLNVTILGVILAVFAMVGSFMFTGCELFGSSEKEEVETEEKSVFLDVGRVYQLDEEDSNVFIKVESTIKLKYAFMASQEMINPSNNEWNGEYVLTFEFERKENNGSQIAFGSDILSIKEELLTGMQSSETVDVFYALLISNIKENSFLLNLKVIDSSGNILVNMEENFIKLP